MHSTQDTTITLDLLFHKNEKLRKTFFAHHALLVAQLASTKEQLDWVTEEMMRIKRTVDGC
jgi:uncharacterized protein (DUF3084 family)